MFVGHLKVDLSRQRQQRMFHLNSDARRRTTAGRHINDEVRRFKRKWQELADAELRDDEREDWRGNGAPRYRDSMVILANTAKTIDRMEGGFMITHRAARWLEYGTKGHEIKPRNAKRLFFPFQEGATRSQRGGPPGNWPMRITKENKVLSHGVLHPGTPAFKFVERARRQYHGGSNRGQRAISSMK